MPVGPCSDGERQRYAALVSSWAEREQRDNPLVAAVDHDPEVPRWYVRMHGEERTSTTVWLTLGQQTLHYEAYFMPAPEENAEALYAYLLRVNNRLFGMRFAIGAENAVYLVGQMPLGALDDDELDRIVGSAYAYGEQYFRPAMRLGFATRFRG